MKILTEYLKFQTQIQKIAKYCDFAFGFKKIIHPDLIKKMCYVGVTNDVDVRDSQHRANSFWKHNCESSDLALAVEKALASNGFDAGSEQGHGNEDSIWVYAYIKTKDTWEHTSGQVHKDPSKPYYTGKI